MRLIVFGATGGTGLELARQGRALGHEVSVFVRSADKVPADLRDRVRVIIGDVFALDAVTAAVAGHDVVFSCLGTRPWRHVDISSGGMRVIAQAMTATGVRRVIAMSSLGVGDSHMSGVGGVLLRMTLRRALRDKHVMEQDLASGKLEWTVVRPGLLTNGRVRGTCRSADDDSLQTGMISRADTAAFMLGQITDGTWVRRRPVIVY